MTAKLAVQIRDGELLMESVPIGTERLYQAGVLDWLVDEGTSQIHQLNIAKLTLREFGT